MIGALLYLRLHSSWNRLLSRVKRLKKPKFLAGFLVGGLYFYFYFFRHFFFGRKPANDPVRELTPEVLAGFELLGALALLGLVLVKWVLPYRRVALAFSEAEVAFLFPAPIHRRTLIHFKLLKSQAAILFTTLFMTLLSGRFANGGSVWIHAGGWWVILSTLNLHFLASSFARTRLLDRGVSNWQRRLAVLLLAAALAVIVFVWGGRAMAAPTLEDVTGLRAFADYLRRVVASGPAPYLLYPFRLVVRPYVARDAVEFALALGPALLLMIAHYWWVIRSDVAFEEASVALAQRRAELVAAARAGNRVSGERGRKAKRAPFEFKSTGGQAVVLLR